MDHKWKVADLIVKIALAILMLWAGYITNSVAGIQAMTYQQESRLNVMESNRFTDTNGLQLEARIETSISASLEEIKTCLNRIQQNRQCD